LDTPVAPDALSDEHRAILDHLERRGASFFVEIQNACGAGAMVRDVAEALWDLVWWGLVTNDTFGPLRAHGQPQRARRGRGASSHGSVGGRWSLVAELVRGEVSPTERAHARAVGLLERHGIVAREVAGLESLQGGFSALYRVY